MSLEVKNLTFSYKNIPMCRRAAERENKVLTEFSACFEPGKITAVTGDNGSGKTTLAKAIMGIVKPEAGTFSVDGQCIDSWSLAERGRTIGYVMQNPARQIFNETVLEEVMYGILNQGAGTAEAEAAAREYIEMFGLTHHMQDFPFNLSHGEKQRLLLAAVLAMKAKYLILDEPTASLDLKHKEVLGSLLKKIAYDRGCGVIVISHDRSFVRDYCDVEVKLNA